MFLVATAVLAALANAQSAPDWNLFPAACASQCAKTIESSYLCQNQYGEGTAVYSCFCEAYPSDAAACATCLTSNDAAALGKLLTATQADCAAQQKDCNFACAFPTCESSDIACQCSETYLANIYNCASCNTANNNAGKTGLTDFQALNTSCANQNYTGPNQDFVTWVQSPTGQAGYTAPTLTATGGGDAATGTFAAATGAITAAVPGASGAGASGAAAGGAGASGAAAAAGASGAAAGTSGAAAGGAAAGASGAAAGSGAAGASGASVSAPAATATSGAGVLAAPVALVVVALAAVLV